MPIPGQTTNTVSAAQPAIPSSDQPRVILTPETGLTGKVALVNEQARFVVLDFPGGRLPAMDQHLSIYRGGLRVAEVKITGPQIDTDIDADVLTGNAEVGDQVREN